MPERDGLDRTSRSCISRLSTPAFGSELGAKLRTGLQGYPRFGLHDSRTVLPSPLAIGSFLTHTKGQAGSEAACKRCDGTGAIELGDGELGQCPSCGGTGERRGQAGSEQHTFLCMFREGYRIKQVLGHGERNIELGEGAKVVRAPSARSAADQFRSTLSVFSLREGIDIEVHLLGGDNRRVFHCEYADKGKGDVFAPGGLPSEPVTMEL